MDEHRSEIKLEPWLVSAGRDSEPGAPLNVPLDSRIQLYHRGWAAILTR